MEAAADGTKLGIVREMFVQLHRKMHFLDLPGKHQVLFARSSCNMERTAELVSLWEFESTYQMSLPAEDIQTMNQWVDCGSNLVIACSLTKIKRTQ